MDEYKSNLNKETNIIANCRNKLSSIGKFQKSLFGTVLSKLGGTNMPLFEDAAYYMSQNIDELTNSNCYRFGFADCAQNMLNSNISNNNMLCEASQLQDTSQNGFDITTQHCQELLRLSYVLNNYNQQINDDKQYDFDNFDTEKTMQILNDYLHLLEYHDSDQYFDLIYQLLQPCHMIQCRILKHFYGKRNNVNRGNDHCLQIVNKIHCYYHHTIDVGLRFSSKDRKLITDYFDQKQISNNVINFQNESIVKMKTIISTKRKNVANSDFINKRLSKFHQVQAHTSPHNNVSNDEYKMYSIGVKFKYSKKQVKCQKSEILVLPKYKGIKEELMCNILSTLNKQQFYNEWKKAGMNAKSIYCKKHYPELTTKQAIVFCLMVYCNFDTLQYEFSRTYRDNIDQHNEFFHLARFLKVGINEWAGTSISGGKVKQFYHGITEKLLFPDVTGQFATGVSFYCPVSTTSSLSVAMNFSNQGQGLIIEFGHGWKLNSAKYADVSWLSDYAAESERLFIAPQTPIQINNIFEPCTGYEFKSILKALAIADYIIHGSLLTEDISEEMQLLIVAIFAHQMSHSNSDYKPFSSLHPYAVRLIDLFFKKQMLHVAFDYFHLVDTYQFIYHILCHSQYQWIKLKSVKDLFPNVRQICIHNICINEMVLRNILDHVANDECKICIKIFDSNMDIIEWTQYKHLFHQINYTIDRTQDQLIIRPMRKTMAKAFNWMNFFFYYCVLATLLYDVRLLVLFCPLVDSLMEDRLYLSVVCQIMSMICVIKWFHIEQIESQQLCIDIWNEDLWWYIHVYLYLIGFTFIGNYLCRIL
eukprot:505228_1